MKQTVWLIILLAMGQVLSGQQSDTRLWTSVAIRYDLNKKWRFSFEEEARFHENISQLDRLNSEFTVNYKINKIFDGGLLYRLIAENNINRAMNLNHRFGAYLNADKKFAGWDCYLKATFQKTYPGFFRQEDWFIPENYVRAEGGVSRELKNKKTEPYTNLEFWYLIAPEYQAFIDQYRFTIGFKQKLNKANRLDFYFRIQHEIQVADPLTAFIFGVGYQFKVR